MAEPLIIGLATRLRETRFLSFLAALGMTKPIRGLLPVSQCGNSFADLGWEFFLNAAGADAGRVLDHYRRRCGQGNDEPDQSGKSKACECDELEQVSVIRIVVTDCAKSHEEDDGGKAGDDDQSDVDRAMQALARAAVKAFGEVLLVVSAHLGRDAGDVVPPACKNVAYDLIDAMRHQKRIASIGSVCEASTSRF